MRAPGYAAVARDLTRDAYGLCVESDKHDDFAGRVKTREQVALLIEDAIKAAVDKERERCVAAYLWWSNGPESDPLVQMDNETFAAWLRSGEDAPGAVTP